MAGINKVILVGNLGKDPEVRHLEGGVSVASFTLATNDHYKDKQGNRVERTEWHNITAWRGLAEMAEKYLKKGQQVYIEGKIRTRQYQDKDNQTRYITEIVADEISMLGGRPQGDGPTAQDQVQVQMSAEETPQTFRQEPELNQLPF
ncbi:MULTISPECIES: single-stranded DNA-binding protein [Hymenobacter]|uniref:Single-stranded DNA-binding protein n=1 Tax=Hymenobacter jejuensis TaxID=2502781 RepID=A0A5B7ZZ26_9BACT|nr:MULTISPECIES: single-stranded DNA-binding protein [Hymenobacter]MBC6991363.1 single-stranded DNA-binding protein [Hymenobacter sp. BT491]QDA59703.1 single-stranded DNA-binding protein [Hymenobacter jejuensis]